MVARTLPAQAYLREIFLYDPKTGVITWRARPLGHFRSARACSVWNARFAGREAGCTSNERGRLYRIIRLDGANWRAHRIAWKLVTGREPAEEIDHRDMVGLNNTWVNIREATHGQNAQNSGPDGGFLKGISWQRGGWMARIDADKTKYYLGRFRAPQRAHAAYCEAAHRLHGEFANFGSLKSPP